MTDFDLTIILVASGIAFAAIFIDAILKVIFFKIDRLALKIALAISRKLD